MTQRDSNQSDLILAGLARYHGFKHVRLAPGVPFNLLGDRWCVFPHAYEAGCDYRRHQDAQDQPEGVLNCQHITLPLYQPGYLLYCSGPRIIQADSMLDEERL